MSNYLAESSVRIVAGLLALSAVSCAGRAASSKPIAASPPPSQESPERVSTIQARDPQPGADRCTGFTLDGIVIGMSRSEIEKIVRLSPLSPSAAMIPGYEKTTAWFRASRPGRDDAVQVAFEPGVADPKIVHLRASIFVGQSDAWPRSLFDLLGSPALARVGEWIWADKGCERTLRLTRVEPLGGGESQPYLLEIRALDAR